ncbi:non-structural maintenance of chromosomes element 1 homolog isoform X1 [Pectinophora gossypiella]|uniref:non-structural maintenance of chromosomes element 1 homolog isoform X1 n=2 Tax=Pectinophora gossypiella TaxID=13191 RepID=UPI00214E561C|nr:non-structural maintenance of chromosomes element 1 homolog isoform X1 [Pectinophora gossypiella]
MTYNCTHRFLLRSLASRGVMSYAETEQVLASFAGGENENSQLEVSALIHEINDQIRPFQQNIKITNDELTNEKVIIFLSLGYDDATKAHNVFSPNELEFFRLLIESIMTTEARQITGIHALNIVGQMKGTLTKTDAQKRLNIWCQMRYLDKDGDNYALGVRAIHEFEGYLRQNMPDTIEECCLCKQIVFRGYNCPACAKAVHTLCLNRYLEKVQKWPCCKEDFNASQIERLQSEDPTDTSDTDITQSENQQTTEMGNTSSGKLTQSQLQLPSPTPDNAVVEPTIGLEDSEEMEATQEVIPEVSQRLPRKRKRLP